MTASIDEHDLLAYVDGQLDPQRRIEVESAIWRAIRRWPRGSCATCISATRSLWPSTSRTPRGAVPASARRQRGVASWPASLRECCSSVGWGAHGWVGGVTPDPVPLPVFADEAIDAHRAFADTGPSGGGDAPRMSQAAGAQATAPIPTFPKRLFRLGVRIVPWDEGSAAQVIFATPEGGLVTLCAAELPDSVTSPPQTATVRGVSVVHWRIGPHAYALCGHVPTGDLLEMAEGARLEEPSL